MTDARISTLRAELREDTALVADPSPRLSWTVAGETRDWIQAATELSDGVETVRLEGRDSVLVDWPFPPLRAGETRDVRVRAFSTAGDETPWSEPLRVTAGFLAADEWVAEPIGLADPERDAQPFEARVRFTLPSDTQRAVLFWTALGVAEPTVNGVAVSDDLLAPGWSAYRDRLVHETVDVTDLVHEGENAIQIAVAGAWYTEKYGFFTLTSRKYGTQPAVLAQLRVTDADGTTHTVAPTGASWECAGDGPVVDSGIYPGEDQDLRRTAATWTPAFVGTRALPGYENVPVPEARIAPPVRRTRTVPVSDVVDSASGGRILDFGQNLVGRVRIRVTGAAGTTVTVRHAEVLEHGELATRPLRNARATATFVLSGGDDVLESRFTFYGFRYAQITGIDPEAADVAVEAVVLHTDMTRTGWFDTSDPLLNRLHENVVWGMRGNFVAIPTDCPQRDERLGWTGDLQIFSPTASFLYECNGFLTSWLRDLALEQKRADGIVPMVIPAALPTFGIEGPTAVWGDAATVVPAVLHERFGDLGVRAAQYESMREWVEAELADTDGSGLWAGTMQLGDWLDPSAPPETPGKAKVSTDIVATAALIRSLSIVSETAALRGDTAAADHYGQLAERSRAAFAAEYITPAGRMMNDAPTAYALAVGWDLVTDPDQRQALTDRLAELVREGGYRIGTGFVGTPLVTDALTAGGHLDAAERLLTQTECPSWLYPVTQGATTVWERWDSLLPDGTVNPGEMTSFNHYALGAIADWMHRTVAGLAPAEPGYRMLRIAPRPLQGLDHAHTRHRTPYGEATVSWQRDGGDVIVRAHVPANTRAVVELEGRDAVEVGSGAHEWRMPSTPSTPRPQLPGMQARLSDVIDDPRAYRALLETVRAFDPKLAEAVRTGTSWGGRRALQTALMFTAPDLQAAVDTAVREATAP